MGFSERDYKRFTHLIARPNGIILVTGPTGSGKTTSLYAALNELNTPTRKIITAEDPVEYYLPGINQVEIKHQIGLDFAAVIRSMLRQAPNVILVGEMRDLETASMGIQASLTGHLVFSTLHTNDAPSAITRLVDMGVPGYLVASSVIGIMAQRLARRLCQKCKVEQQVSEQQLRAIGYTEEEIKSGIKLYGPAGCSACSGGYKGRVGIYEIMVMNDRLAEAIMNGANSIELNRIAVEQGMQTLRRSALEKASLGLTSVAEVKRVTS